ncbi:Hypothetical protein NocV09_05900090 [Nannochloropsis oceanica]
MSIVHLGGSMNGELNNDHVRLLDYVYGDFNDARNTAEKTPIDRAILTPRNKDVDTLNDHAVQQGLANGTWLLIMHLSPRVIQAKILTESQGQTFQKLQSTCRPSLLPHIPM